MIQSSSLEQEASQNQEVEAIQQSQAQESSLIKDVNADADIKIIGQQLEKFVGDGQHGLVYEKFGQYGFTFVGEFRFGVRVGIWSILNKNGEWIGGGEYNDAGRKVGEWIDIDLDLMGEVLGCIYYIQLIGKYQDGTRIDRWEIKNTQGKTIGGGQYNDLGNKDGQWIDIQQILEIFDFVSYIQHIGQYQDGIRIDQWEINLDNKDKKCHYNKSGRKDGLWIDVELSLEYYYQYVGNYQDGKRIDKWEIKYKGDTVAGGQYNKSGRKDGEWIDIEYVSNYYYLHFGKYQDGIRIDQWVIKYRAQDTIGGGHYNKSGRKEGQWVDIELSFRRYYQHIGKYQDGNRIDQWEIKLQGRKTIRGGHYNKSGRKDGQWTDIEFIDDDYYQYVGKYNEGTRVDQWEIKDYQGNKIGGGHYNEQGTKVGHWIDIEFLNESYCQYLGKYHEGTRIDRWEIKDNDGNKIGGGHYKESGRKDGQWIDIELQQKSSQYYHQHIGNYQDGARINQWEIKDKIGKEIRDVQYTQSIIKDTQQN